MWRLMLVAVSLLLLAAGAGLLVGCGSQATDNSNTAPVARMARMALTATPRPATDKDIALLKEIFATNAQQVKSYHQVLEEEGDLFREPGTQPQVTRLETDVEAPGRTHTWGQYFGSPSESYVISGTVYMKDSMGNWTEPGGASSEAEVVGGMLLTGNPRQVDEADRVLVFDPGETINGIATQHFLWEKRETSGFFTGGTFTYQVWVDPQTNFAHKYEYCLWVNVSASAGSSTPGSSAPGSSTRGSSTRGSSTPGAELGVRVESCTTTIYSRHNEPVSIGAPPIIGPTPTPQTSAQLAVREPVCGTWDALRWVSASDARSFIAVDASSPDNVWAASPRLANRRDSGEFVPAAARWDGKEWTLFPVSRLDGEWVAGTFFDIAAVSKDDIWAVGDAHKGEAWLSLVVHWDGHEWKRLPSPNPGQNLNYFTAIKAISATDVWMAGWWSTLGHTLDKSDDKGGIYAMHWNGSELKALDLPGNGYVSDIDASSGTDVWVVGDVVLHWDGKAWREVTVPGGASVDRVAAISPDDAWAVGRIGDQAISLHWDGKEWHQVKMPLDQSGRNTLNSIAARGPDDVWAAGEEYISQGTQSRKEALVLHWNGNEWQRMPFPRLEADQTLNGLTITSKGEVWAVGETEGKGEPGLAGLLARFTPGACGK